MIKSKRGHVEVEGTATDLVGEVLTAILEVKKVLLWESENAYLDFLNKELRKIATIEDLEDLELYTEVL